MFLQNCMKKNCSRFSCQSSTANVAEGASGKIEKEGAEVLRIDHIDFEICSWPTKGVGPLPCRFGPKPLQNRFGSV